MLSPEMNLIWIVTVGTGLFLILGISLIGAIALSQRHHLQSQATIMNKLTAEIERRRTTEKELQASESRYRKLVEDINEMYCVLDRDFRIVYASPNFRTAVSDSGGLDGKSFNIVVDGRDRQRFEEFFRDRGKEGAIDTSCEFRIAGSGGKIIWIEQNTRIVREQSGVVREYRSVLRDVTHRKSADLLLRTLSHRIVAAQEAERRRVARDLHDGVIQLLSTVQFRIKSSRKNAKARTSEQKSIQEASDLLDESIEEIRRISHNLRPSALDDLGLMAAVKGICEDFAKRTKVKVSLDLLTDGKRFPEIIELTLFRVIQEALNNIERHSKATHVDLAISDKDGIVTARISDNGRGFDPRSPRTPRDDGGGAGIVGMNERVRFLGGTIEIVSRPRRGAKVIAQIPMRIGKADKNLES